MTRHLVFGHNEGAETIVVHLNQPRLIARVVETSDDGLPRHPDEDADVLSGIVFSANYEGGSFLLCEVVKLDDDGDYDFGGALGAMAEFAAFHLREK